MDTSISTPYSSVVPYIRGFPTWVPEWERERIAAYKQYEDMYWNNPDAYEMTRRGEDEPIYVPNAMTVCDTTAHYFMKDLSIEFEGEQGEENEKSALQAFLDRERFLNKFRIAKHAGVIRGDFLLHVTADPVKPQGRRLSVNSVDPASYFPHWDDDDLNRLLGVSLVEVFKTEQGESRAKKLRYWYEGDPDSPEERVVWREELVYVLNEWFEPEAEPVEILLPPEPLPKPIDAIPVYHFKNKAWDGQPFGSSEVRGFEGLLRAVNGTVSDEDLALAFQGLGVYATNAAKPKDAQGREIDWVVSPAMVVELSGNQQEGDYFKRVEGITTVQPHTDLTKYLEEKLWQASGTSEIARGIADVAVVQSGVALAIKFLPMQAKIEDRDLEGMSRLKNFWFDWRNWMSAYEETKIGKLIVPRLGPKLPQDRERILRELNYMYDRAIISGEYYRKEVEKLGYVFPPNIVEQIKKEGDIVKPKVQLPPASDSEGGETPPKGGA